MALQLCAARPQQAQSPLSLAKATRECSLPDALKIPTDAVQRFPEELSAHFDLACCEAQLGNLDGARSSLGEAIPMQPKLRELALEDPDLAPLRDELR